jgi:hypothetical protein
MSDTTIGSATLKSCKIISRRIVDTYIGQSKEESLLEIEKEEAEYRSNLAKSGCGYEDKNERQTYSDKVDDVLQQDKILKPTQTKKKITFHDYNDPAIDVNYYELSQEPLKSAKDLDLEDYKEEVINLDEVDDTQHQDGELKEDTQTSIVDQDLTKHIYSYKNLQGDVLESLDLQNNSASCHILDLDCYIGKLTDWIWDN